MRYDLPKPAITLQIFERLCSTDFIWSIIKYLVGPYEKNWPERYDEILTPVTRFRNQIYLTFYYLRLWLADSSVIFHRKHHENLINNYTSQESK